MSEEKNPQNDAFSLLTKVCKVKRKTLASAFDNVDSYNIFHKKREGKKDLIIKEPQKPLKFIQKRLLHFLYKLNFRTNAYNKYDFYRMLAHEPVLDHLLDRRMNGQMLGKSLQSAVKAHLGTNRNPLFLIKMDLKNAYPSVNINVLEKILFQIFLDECKAYYFAYQKRLDFKKETKWIKDLFINKKDIIQLVVEKTEDTVKFSDQLNEYEKRKAWEKEVNNIIVDLGFGSVMYSWDVYRLLFEDTSERFFVRKETTIHNYPHAPFFPTLDFPEFRKRIRELAIEGKDIEQSEIFEIIKYFTQYFVRLTTFQGSLPKGSPTSGMLLNIVISDSKMLYKIEQRNEKCSIYVDDILITTDKKPDASRIQDLKNKIEESGIFKHNPKKIKVYDLRNKSGSVLGMKLVRRPLSEYEEIYFLYSGKGVRPRGYVKAVRKKKIWMKLAVTLSKKKQNQYRAFLYRVTTKEYSEEEKNKALGYHGQIISVYGWPVTLMPSSLAKTVRDFRKKFNIIGIKRYRHPK